MSLAEADMSSENYRKVTTDSLLIGALLLCVFVDVVLILHVITMVLGFTNAAAAFGFFMLTVNIHVGSAAFAIAVYLYSLIFTSGE